MTYIHLTKSVRDKARILFDEYNECHHITVYNSFPVVEIPVVRNLLIRLRLYVFQPYGRTYRSVASIIKILSRSC